MSGEGLAASLAEVGETQWAGSEGSEEELTEDKVHWRRALATNVSPSQRLASVSSVGVVEEAAGEEERLTQGEGRHDTQESGLPGTRGKSPELDFCKRLSMYEDDEAQTASCLTVASWDSLTMLQVLAPNQRRKLIASMKPLHFEADDVIITRGTVGTTMYFIDFGTACAMVDGEVVTRLSSGDFFGEMSFIATWRKFLRHGRASDITDTDVLRTADVMATCKCRVMEFSVRDLITVLARDDDAKRAVLHVLSDQAIRHQHNLRRHASRDPKRLPLAKRVDG